MYKKYFRKSKVRINVKSLLAVTYYSEITVLVSDAQAYGVAESA